MTSWANRAWGIKPELTPNLVEEVFILSEEHNPIPVIVVQNREQRRHIVLKVWVGAEKVPESCSVTES